MTEVWLHSNRRVLLLSLVPVGAIGGVGALLLALVDWTPLRVVGWVFAGIAAFLLLGILGQLRQARIGYRDGNVLFNLRAGPPVAVPAEIVEAFFLGQGPTHLPLSNRGVKPAETVNLVARLSQKAPQWSRLEVKPALGAWCDGYVTIRGTWCERLDNEVIRRLNHRLREIHELHRAIASMPASTGKLGPTTT